MLISKYFIPAFFAGLYVWLSPRVSRIIMVFWKNQESGTKREIVKIEDDTPLTREEIKQIRAQMQKEIDERDDKLERRDITVSRLEARLSERDIERTKQNEDIAQLVSDLDSAKKSLSLKSRQVVGLEEQIKGYSSNVKKLDQEKSEVSSILQRALALLPDFEKAEILNSPADRPEGPITSKLVSSSGDYIEPGGKEG